MTNEGAFSTTRKTMLETRLVSILLLLLGNRLYCHYMSNRVKFVDDVVDGTLSYDPKEPTIYHGQSCVECFMLLPYECQPYATLKPCDHLMCSGCLGMHLAAKQATENLLCSRCEGVVSSHIPHKLVFMENHQEFVELNEVQHAVRIARDVYNDPNEDKDPLRYWFNSVPEEARIGKGIIYFVNMERNENGDSVLSDPVTCHFDIDNGCCSSVDDEMNLEEIFR